ncbi:hypothetical protein [Streptococcus dysgalactiae]|uniref:hypothetical protein n=1 Tax=Streptococcus dysgalactiae TaxID=1334 RepID=UPI001951CD8A|nr:hypothetical protein [Streptococcus dysgalactiae subsp. equisimilis]
MKEHIVISSDVILADATHQSNCGGYVLWHAMLVDQTGLGQTFFYALLPNESGETYKRVVKSMRDMCPGTSSCKTVVADRSLAQ